MGNDAFFCHLDTDEIARLVVEAQQAVCFAAPGIRLPVAKAMLKCADRLGPEMITVSLDFDERVIRMGYGDFQAVELLRDAGISVNNSPGLRTSLVIVDNRGFIFTPTALYLEAEAKSANASNAIRMSDDQVAEALARLSPVAKVIAMAQAKTPEEKKRIENLPLDVGSSPVTEEQVATIGRNLVDVPATNFDLARQVRVFEPYLQYVELKLTGAAIQRFRLTIPAKIQQLGGASELEGRLKTTIELIEKDSQLSSKPLEAKLNEIRSDLTPRLGKDHGRVVLKSKKTLLANRLAVFRAELEQHQAMVKDELQAYLDKTRQQIVEYYVPIVLKSPPDALMGQIWGDPAEDDARLWLNDQLDRVFPVAETLVQDMRLEERYMDFTYETLSQDNFLDLVKSAFNKIDWDKAYNEFLAAAENSQAGIPDR
ncbi:hypothetical protein [Methylomonas koyamae]|uniref:hypothetical protein n=1 Tax=Methylomonas koyamae TaxID=702114 RepID=UPI0006D1CDC4|nr:hypothetical protein [Methylomonas koyamae]BBL57582.1 hypothetical protein MKFW12EY_11950 [Methylomonas koyamae]